jgi:hypothetical protein
MTCYRVRGRGWWRSVRPASLDGCGAGPGGLAPGSGSPSVEGLLSALVNEALHVVAQWARRLGKRRPAGLGRGLWPGPRRGLAGPARRQARHARAGSSACRCGCGSLSSPRQSRGPVAPVSTGAAAVFGTRSASDGMTWRRVRRHPKVDLTGGIFGGTGPGTKVPPGSGTGTVPADQVEGGQLFDLTAGSGRRDLIAAELWTPIRRCYLTTTRSSALCPGWASRSTACRQAATGVPVRGI